MIDCSISIVNFNTRDLLEKCIDSVFKYTQGISYELIVIDNASGDGSVENVRKKFPSVKVIQNSENRHFTKASNQGLRASQGRYAFTLNPDCYFEDDSIVKMVRYMDQHPEVGACGLTFLNPDRSVQSLGHRFPSVLYPFFQLLFINTFFPNNPVREAREYRENKLQEIDAMGGGGIMVRREVIESVGILDENYLIYFEDTDWCKRIRAAGWKIVHLPDEHVFHYGGQSTIKHRSGRNRFDKILFKSMAYYYGKHYGAGISILIKILFYGFHYPLLVAVRSLKDWMKFEAVTH